MYEQDTEEFAESVRATFVICGVAVNCFVDSPAPLPVDERVTNTFLPETNFGVIVISPMFLLL